VATYLNRACTWRVAFLSALILCFVEPIARPQSALDASVLIREIANLRHTNPEAALKTASLVNKDAYEKAGGQRLRLLCAYVLIENGVTAGVDSLLAFDPQDAEIRARLLGAKAYLQRAGGDEDNAAKTYARALAATDSVSDPCWKAEVGIHYAQVLVERDKNRARSQLRGAKQDADTCPDKFWTAYRYLVQSNIDETGHQYGLELASSQNAAALAARYNFSQLIAVTKGNLALAYFHLGNYQEALKLLSEAEKWYPKEALNLAIDIGHRARVHYWRDEDAAAAADYQRAIEILKRLKLENNSWCLRFLDELTTVLIGMGRLNEADAYNERALRGSANSKLEQWTVFTARINNASILRLRGRTSLAFEQLRQLQDTVNRGGDLDPDAVWRFHGEMAETQAAKGMKAQAEQEFKRSIITAGGVRSTIGEDWDRMTFSVYVAKLVAAAIDFEIGGKEDAEALRLAEEFRAQMLAEKLQRSKTPVPRQFQDIARARNAVILSYWITNKNSYVWATTAKAIKAFPLTGLGKLDSEILRHNDDIRNQRALLDSPKTSNLLYRELVSPAESLLWPGANVIIVPDGPLAALNFETLIPPSTPAKFWLENVTVTVAPSLAVLRDSKPPVAERQRLLLVGGTIPLDSKQLPGTVQEIEDIRKLFPNLPQLSLMREDATATRFLDSKPEAASHVHISAHAVANTENPLDSYILFTPDKAHTDGRLHAHSLMKLKLQSYLVTLSACESAGGRALPGEGQIGLTWALLSAGAQHVVASLSRVSDSATAIFMHEFYTFLKDGEDPATALHNAKLVIAKKRPPYYWAAFQLYTR